MTHPSQKPSRDAVQGWRDLKFGMFIHWGLFSLAGGVWKGERVTRGYSEQIQMWAGASHEEYAAFAEGFNPTNFDPDAICALAKAAGMKYIVITSKHHDGFSMFHTKMSDFNIVGRTPYKKDPIKLLAEACRKHDLKFGVYFSLVDWSQGHEFDGNNENPLSDEMEEFIVGQLYELVTRYGSLVELWFDMSSPTPAQSKRFADLVHKFQPNCMVNWRVWNNQGDFIVMGDNETPDYKINEPWETPASIYHSTWGYRSWQERGDVAGKVKELTTNLIKVVSLDGQYLLNIGPMGDGSVVPFEADVLQGMGHWVKRHGEALFATIPNPYETQEWGVVTAKKDALYLHILEWPTGGTVTLPRLQNSVVAVSSVDGSISETLSWQKEGEDVVIKLPLRPLNPIATVIKVEYSGLLKVSPRVVCGLEGVIPASAWTEFYSQSGSSYEGQRRTTVERTVWVRAGKSGTYSLVFRGVENTGNKLCSIKCGRQTLKARIADGVPVKGLELAKGELSQITIKLSNPTHRQEDLGFTFETVEFLG